MASDYLDRLAEFVTETRLESLGESTVTAARAVVLDTLGAVLAGSQLEENANLARLAREMSSAGRATLWGHSGGVQPAFAALVNGTAGVALELDEGSRLGGGHPSIHVTPAAIAVAEDLGRSGKAALESVIVGYEVTSRIGTGTRVRPEVHSHGTWGTIGAAAATARLLGFDREETRCAMNLAVSMSPANTWTPCLEGATVRNLYPGRSWFQGVMAAYLGRCGFTAVKDGPADLYGSILGLGFDPEAAVQDLGVSSKLRIEQNYFKFHACCLYNHPALDAVQAITGQHRFAPGDVAHIKVNLPPMASTMADPAPENMLSAKFSIPYAVAAAIVTGDTGVAAFWPDQLDNREIRELARRTEVAPDAQMDIRRYDRPAAEVTVTLQDGRVVRESVVAHHGDAMNPASLEEVERKFTTLADGVLGRETTRKVLAAVKRLDKLDGISELTALLARDSRYHVPAESAGDTASP